MADIDALAPPLTLSALGHPTRRSLAAKRTFDVVVGALLLMGALPVLAVAALAIMLEDGGPVLFTQRRVGRRGKPFQIFKLRTMNSGGSGTPAPNTGVFHPKACPTRITRVGAVLRSTSIDELPQLLNVLGGSMSIVGPRPLAVGEAASMVEFVARRGLVKPGMTGLWQVSGRSDLSDAERIRLDHAYIDNWSCVQDLRIFWRTLHAVFKRRGAY
jgi:lipopolysaccharide/colanic/teichoic acid biosynthesis glycosyltransferase